MNKNALTLTFLACATMLHAQSACDKPIPQEVTADLTLPANCEYHSSLSVHTGNLTINCNGSTFNGDDTLKEGLQIDSQGKPLSHVTIRNCTFKNFKGHGILIGWSGPDGNKGTNHADIYARTPSDILIDNVHIQHTRQVGLYIDDYVQRVTIQNSEVRDAASPGIYLEHSSRNITLRNNLITENARGKHREGLAIDSSANNIVENNTFENNGGGGIFLYKNCHEHADRGIKSVERWQHSDNNIIRNNTFRNEKVGIWIASRQSRDLHTWNCGDKPMNADAHFYEDFANHNTVQNNTFCSVEVPIRIEGDNNTITGNRIDARNFDARNNKSPIELPVTQREKILHRPQTGNTITGNTPIDCTKK